jgi:hypothetical protein
MVEENKIRVYAPIQVQEEVEKSAREKASVLAFPEEKQGDLQYIRSLLVSAGTNKNGAHFLPSEMMRAQGTIVNKAIDIEHEEDKVIGHIYNCAFLFKDGTEFDPRKVMAEFENTARDPDSLDIDIVTTGVIHKMRFPDLAEEISNGDWKVSMECYFKDFDIKVGEQIITRDEAKALGYNPDDLIGGFVKVMAGQKALGKHFVARVLRNITFSGMGIVKNPANPHSIIMETAAHREQMERGEQVVDLEQIDNLRGHKIELSSTKEKEQEEVATAIKVVSEEGDMEVVDQVYVELDKETGGIKRVLTVGGKEDAALRWTGPGLGGPGTVTSYPDEICKSFKKRVTKFNALDQSEAQVVHEHWCALFEEPCPVIGATAKAPECLRNVRNRTVRDERDDTLTKTVREIVEGAPANTFQTVVHQPAGVEQVSRASVDRHQQVARIRSDAEELRNSLRSFVAAEKKTSE